MQDYYNNTDDYYKYLQHIVRTSTITNITTATTPKAINYNYTNNISIQTFLTTRTNTNTCTSVTAI